MTTPKTPFEQKGWKATDKLRVKRGCSTAERGDVVTLDSDDGTDCPYFKGSSIYDRAAIQIDDLELISEGSVTTGSSVDYYKIAIENPTTLGERYIAECNDIIEALGMNFAEGNIFKAVWRTAASRQGNGKAGHTALYDAEKIVFFGERLIAQAKGEENE